MPRNQGYSALEDAAEAALQFVASLDGSSRTEYIGILYQDPKTGKYKFTDPVEGKSDETRGAFRVPKGSARGIFHNHPVDDTGRDSRSAEFFSPDDIAMSQQTGLRSFISANGQTLGFDPNEGKISRAVQRRGKKGEPVLARIPVEDISARMRQRLAAHHAETFAKQ